MKLKKMMLLAALSVAAFTTASAQEPEVKTEFVPHWYLQLQGGAAYTLGEAKFKDLITPAAQVAFGRQFNPWLGLRLQASGWQSKGGWVTPEQKYKWNYVSAGLDLKLSLTNLIFGWSAKRVFNLGIFGGAAANIGWNNKEAANLVPVVAPYQLEYLWDGTKVRPVGRFGLDMDFRCSDRVTINLEGNANILSDKYNSKKAGNPDWYFNVLAGVKIALGPTVRRTVIEPEPVPEPTPAPAPVVVKKKPEPKPIVKAPELQTEIFYAIRETVAVGGEEVKVQNLISFLKQNPSTKVSITGYADAGTGNAKINMMYSEQRAQNVAKALTEAGIDAARITVDAKGDTVQPFAENDKNRVSIAIAK